ncbi:MAG: TRAP transporter substrate-binding protein [Gammaproteobacteria bacterium]|nr:MAG: TRAP transporter substrate-binding protein [Gammaproteobacteria bacterium]
MMKRRTLLSMLGVGAGAALLGGCRNEQKASSDRCRDEVIHWTMVTTWPKNFQGLGEGAEYLAQLIGALSGGRLQVKVMGAGELVPALQVFEAVASGTAQMGHGAAYYWKGKLPASPFFSAVPFGMTAQEVNAWLLKGDGLELWEALYRPFGVVPRPVGNTGVQMAGWFNKEIRSLEDIKGLKMRIPGLGGEVLKRAGGVPVLMPGSEVFTALERGAIDAAEWVGPYNDLAFGLHKAAKYYYYPGWHEPGSVMEALINEKALKALPEDLQAVVLNACLIANQDMLAAFMQANFEALQTLQKTHGVQLRKLPDDVLARLKSISEEVVRESIEGDTMGQRIYQSYREFMNNVRGWTALSEQSYLAARG